jgi:hypothetical protein
MKGKDNGTKNRARKDNKCTGIMEEKYKGRRNSRRGASNKINKCTLFILTTSTTMIYINIKFTNIKLKWKENKDKKSRNIEQDRNKKHIERKTNSGYTKTDWNKIWWKIQN